MSKQNEVIVQYVKNILKSDNLSPSYNSRTTNRKLKKKIKWEPPFINSHNSVKFGWNQSRNTGVQVWFVKIVLNEKSFIHTSGTKHRKIQKIKRDLPFTKFGGYQLRKTGVSW